MQREDGICTLLPYHALVVGCHLLAVRHQELAALFVPAGSAEGTLLLPRRNAFLLPRHDQNAFLRSQSEKKKRKSNTFQIKITNKKSYLITNQKVSLT